MPRIETETETQTRPVSYGLSPVCRACQIESGLNCAGLSVDVLRFRNRIRNCNCNRNCNRSRCHRHRNRNRIEWR